ncbi:hypothetical protein ACH79_16000 [Bradyrhizobium sp. CCBAU 051011]|uniref:UDP-glucose dehydrogenase family protein n=1 Tax=Bradyrhizobium sp. CCBAU 051011 TaxID=858422 RepID=UPI001374337C|nr:UDP-glucose/GDP-mannose dehydrogenase family protein [Bradyrhizobium sp. CCBAU 051011]QHO73917.1 hypothetical protein ACH79_16000 [Bradyrhizobium sp. CCBAU 051011]
MRIAMIGAGYIGLVSGACFADFAHDVTCIDKNAEKIAALKQSKIPIYEPDLDQLVTSGVNAGRLKFATDLSSIGDADAVFIAVGTASRRGDGHADLSYVPAAAHEIATHLKDFTVVTKSTVPVGTGDEAERIVREANPAADFAVASNPEFLREGAAIRDFQHPDRIVVGTADERARKVMGGDIRGKTIAMLGLTFKPDTDDGREAPSLPLIAGAKVGAHDPVGMEQAKKELDGSEYCDDPYTCTRGADALVIVTEWKFRGLDLERIKRAMAAPVIVDLRNIYRPEDVRAQGFKYESIGRQ